MLYYIIYRSIIHEHSSNTNKLEIAAMKSRLLKPSVKTITIKTLLTVIMLAALIMTIVIGFSFRTLSHKIVEGQALTISELVKAGLTSHMKAGIMDKRNYFLEEIRSLNEINSMSIIRSKEVNDQFGSGSHLEGDMDPVAAGVFKSGEPDFVLNEYSLHPNIRAVIPFNASSKGALSCLSCHEVAEGTVLGVVDIEIDLAEYRNIALLVMIGIGVISTIFIILIVGNIFKTVQIYVKDPLESLVNKAREAYTVQKPVSEDDFESMEFQNVAKEINLFNEDIIKTQKLLEEKNQELANLNDEIEETLKETVFAMGVIEEVRSKETKNHTKRVTEYCRLFADKLGFSEEEKNIISAAAPLHDIGKIGISDYILLKSGKLTDDEQEIMKDHTKIGYSMLVHSQRDILKAAAVIAYQHHEKWDGTGYPQGLKGNKIHIYARIAAMADVFDALSTKRTYKEAWPLEAIISNFKEMKGSHFDPELVDIFLANIDDFIEIQDRYY